jgi:hypothetical protein
VLDAASGKVKEQIRVPIVAAGVVFSPDGKVLAAGGEHPDAVHLFDAATGREIRRIDVDGPVTAVTFSPNGGVLAVATRPRTVTLWDMQEKEKPATANAPIRLELWVPDPKEGDDINMVRLDGKIIRRVDLTNVLRQLVQAKRTELLLDVGDNVPYVEVKEILNAADQAGIKRVEFVRPKAKAAQP